MPCADCGPGTPLVCVDCPGDCEPIGGPSTLSPTDLATLVIRWFPDGVVPYTGLGIRETAYAVCRAESGGTLKACGDGCLSFGPWQEYLPCHPKYATSPASLFLPDVAASQALQLSSNGTDWTAWCTWERIACGGTGRLTYRAYLDEATAAIAAALGAPAPAPAPTPPPPVPPTPAPSTGNLAILVSSGGAPVPGVVVYIIGPVVGSGTTDAGGGVFFGSIPGGTYAIATQGAGYAAASTSTQLQVGVTETVPVSILQAGSPPPPPGSGGTPTTGAAGGSLLVLGVVAAAATGAVIASRRGSGGPPTGR